MFVMGEWDSAEIEREAGGRCWEMILVNRSVDSSGGTKTEKSMIETGHVRVNVTFMWGMAVSSQFWQIDAWESHECKWAHQP
jgi:hypothetical protein